MFTSWYLKATFSTLKPTFYRGLNPRRWLPYDSYIEQLGHPLIRKIWDPPLRIPYVDQ